MRTLKRRISDAAELICTVAIQASTSVLLVIVEANRHVRI
jgi:hypothetical protein